MQSRLTALGVLVLLVGCAPESENARCEDRGDRGGYCLESGSTCRGGYPVRDKGCPETGVCCINEGYESCNPADTYCSQEDAICLRHEIHSTGGFLCEHTSPIAYPDEFCEGGCFPRGCASDDDCSNLPCASPYCASDSTCKCRCETGQRTTTTCGTSGVEVTWCECVDNAWTCEYYPWRNCP